MSLLRYSFSERWIKKNVRQKQIRKMPYFDSLELSPSGLINPTYIVEGPFCSQKSPGMIKRHIPHPQYDQKIEDFMSLNSRFPVRFLHLNCGSRLSQPVRVHTWGTLNLLGATGIIKTTMWHSKYGEKGTQKDIIPWQNWGFRNIEKVHFMLWNDLFRDHFCHIGSDPWLI